MELVHRLNQEYYDANGYKEEIVGSIAVAADFGRRFARITVGRQVHTFVELDTGNILKSATFKAPAKNGVRGTIYADDFGASAITHYGAKYLR